MIETYEQVLLPEMSRKGYLGHPVGKPLLGLSLVSLLCLTGCGQIPPQLPGASPHHSKQKQAKKPENTIESHYQPEEKALIQMAAEDILSKEKNKAYQQLYNKFASKKMLSHMPLKVFIRKSQCVEDYMGGVAVYHFNQAALGKKETAEGLVTDRLLIPVIRTHGQMVERLSFIREGGRYKLYSLKWLSERVEKQPSYQTCLKGIYSDSVEPVETKTDTPR